MNAKFSAKLLCLGVVLSFILQGCVDSSIPADNIIEQKKVSEFEPTVALKWNELYLDVERNTDGYRPPISARTLGYIGLATYESVVNGMPEYKSLSGRYAGLVVPVAASNTVYHWPTVLNTCYSTSLRNFFPTAPASQIYKIYTLESSFNQEFKTNLSDDVYNRSIDYGKRMADAVYAFSKTDATGHDAYLNPTDKNYVDGTQAGEWRRTAPDFTNPLLPNWGRVRTFAINEDDKKIPAPIKYSESASSLYYQQGKEVQSIVNEVKSGKDYENNWIAIFWSDDCAKLTFTPAGRWIAVSNQIVRDHAKTLDKAIITYSKMGMALADAGIAAWNEKYRYKVQRPIDYIRTVFGDKNWNTIMCPDGNGAYFTPPFPAYPSGHATFGAAAAEVLTAEYGINVSMTDRCHEGRTEFIGTPRAFPNFYSMAEENAYSRIPIGVHWRMDSEQGVKLGYRVGRKVNDLPWKK
ncbi:MAG: vanadium-dependent haloperoxidase [Saprospiraceae bacterium]